MKIVMFVHNAVTYDARVLREAATLADAGHDVTIVGRADAGEARPMGIETRGSVQILRVPSPVIPMRRWRLLRRRPWGLRVDLATLARDALRARPPRLERILLAAAGGLLMLPWVATRAAIRAVRGPRPDPPPDALDWLATWQLAVGGWADRAADAVPFADAWHGHDLSGMLAADRARRRVGGALVFDAHELLLESGRTALQPGWARAILRRREQAAYRAADALVTVNPALASELARRYGPKPRVAIVHNAPARWLPPSTPRRPLRRAIGLGPDVPLALYHGGLSPDRGLGEVIAAIRRPELAGIHVAFLGYGPLESELRALEADPALGGRVHVLAAVPPDELMEWVADADVGLMPIQPTNANNRLSTPNKLFECLAAGVPVVSSDLPARTSIVRDDPRGPVGEVCDPGDPASVAAAILRIVGAPPEARQALRARCLAAAHERWNWETESIALVEMYAELAADRLRRPTADAGGAPRAGGSAGPAAVAPGARSTAITQAADPGNAPRGGGPAEPAAIAPEPRSAAVALGSRSAAIGPAPGPATRGLDRPLRVLTVARWYPSHDAPGRGSFVADLVRATSVQVDSRVASFDQLLVRGPAGQRSAVADAARRALEHAADASSLLVVPWSWGAPGIPVARLPVVRIPGDARIDEVIAAHVAALRPFVRQLAETWRPDVMHAHTALPDGVTAATVGRELGIPVLVTEHLSGIDRQLSEPRAAELYRTLLGEVELVVVSPNLAQRIARRLGVEPGDMTVIPNPVPVDVFAAGEATRDPDELLWVGSLSEHKATDVLLAAFALARSARPTLRLRLIGEATDAAQWARWRTLAGSLGIEDGVRFEGWQERASVAAAMARAAVLVHPAPFETFGVVAAEAILSGLPVVSRPFGAVPWLIELAGGFGAVADGEDAEAFASAIGSLLDRRDTLDAPAARRRLLGHVDPAVVAGEWVRRYRQAAGIDEGDTGALAAPTPLTGIRVADAANPLPLVLLGTARDEAIRLVAGLPTDLRERVTLVTASAPTGAGQITLDPTDRLVEVATPPWAAARVARGGVPARIARRLRRVIGVERRLAAARHVAWLKAIRAASGEQEGPPRQVVALDAHAATTIGSLAHRGIRLAPGSLRWLADRWDGESRGMPQREAAVSDGPGPGTGGDARDDDSAAGRPSLPGG